MLLVGRQLHLTDDVEGKMSDDKDRTAELYELEKSARKLGHTIGDTLPKNVGFVLWLFEWGHDGWATYISNAQRDSMIEAVEELLKRLRTPGGVRPPLKGDVA